jgi:hypothetical protein
MKKILFSVAVMSTIGFTACKKKDFADSYANPSSISTSTIEKQFAGMVSTNREYVIPAYWNYFVVLRTTLNRYNQAVGWENVSGQYIPGAASIGDRWNNFYNFVAQYKEIQNIYNKLTDADKALFRIYKIASDIYYYDHTQKVVDLHGGIPWSEAGMMSANGGDYTKSLPKYDDATTIYTKMLDDLKAYADELNTITVAPGVLTGFKNQDLINKGDLTKWKKYTNSLRLRMLTRVSGVSSLSSRANTEIGQILGNAATYPVVSANTENIQINVFTLATDFDAESFQSGLEDWNGNIAPKAMIDHMKTNSDPRLRAMFEPGTNAAGVYTGLDQTLTAATQASLIAGGTIAIYNRSTLSRNDFFPGVLITAAEVSFLAAEYYLKANNLTAAKTAYEAGIKQSIEGYYLYRSLSNDNTAGALTPTNNTEIATYTASAGVNWTLAATNADKLKLIATQKWLHYSVVQPIESWAEVRRLNAPVLTFWQDDASAQKLPPNRWVYPSSEITYNAANYETVKSSDNLTTKIFWDIN